MIAVELSGSYYAIWKGQVNLSSVAIDLSLHYVLPMFVRRAEEANVLSGKVGFQAGNKDRRT